MATRLETKMALKERAAKRREALVAPQPEVESATNRESRQVQHEEVAPLPVPVPVRQRISYFVAKRDFSAVIHGQFLSFFYGQRLVDKSLVSILQAQKCEDIEEMVDDDDTAVINCPHCGSAFMVDRG